MKHTKDGHPFCFKCKYFYHKKGEHGASAHCDFEFYKTCKGRLYAVDMGKDFRRVDATEPKVS